jgi:hypothetical protein
LFIIVKSEPLMDDLTAKIKEPHLRSFFSSASDVSSGADRIRDERGRE